MPGAHLLLVSELVEITHDVVGKRLWADEVRVARAHGVVVVGTSVRAVLQPEVSILMEDEAMQVPGRTSVRSSY
jgi:hypothetical protein